MPIKSRFYQSQNAPKLSCLSSKVETISVDGVQFPPQTPPRWGWGHTVHTPRRFQHLDPRSLGARLDSRASASVASIRPP